MLDTSTTLDHIAERATQLYSLPAVAIQVLELTSQPEVDSRRLKECIENDPALTTRVLRVVNSSIFGLSREVGDLTQALALLGTKPLKLLVLGFSLPPNLLTGIAAETLSRYWKHTLTKAVAAREISDRLWHVSGEEAFIVGLLQDIGLLALAQQIGEQYVSFLESVHAEGADRLQMERDAMGFDHTQLSACLLSGWNLPDALTQAVRVAASLDLIDELPIPERTLPRVVYVAELLACTISDGRAAALAELLQLGRQWRELEGADWDWFVTDIEQRVAQVADVFNLQLPSALDYRDMLSRAHAQLATVALDAAGDLLRKRASVPISFPENSRLPAELESLTDAVSHLDRTLTPSPQSASDQNRPAAHASDEPTPAGAAWQRATPQMLSASPSGSPVEDDAALLARLRVAVSACRQIRSPLSLLLIDVDRYDDLAFKAGDATAAAVLLRVEALCRGLEHPGLMCQRVRESRFGVVLPKCDRAQAVEIGNQLRLRLRSSAVSARERSAGPLTISIGISAVNVPPRNFAAEDLVESADRCLRGVASSGGDGLKSIELC
ncbi:MAG: HDOD domain-containing protein [Planctomycetes bacterium]|nr:HDOD domain-containing protein [Planctomycetota bacterium]